MSIEPGQVASYYDELNTRLFKQYVNGNKRVTIAFDLIMALTKQKSFRNVLDIGCGIGVSSGFIAELLPECKVTGIDISTASIGIACKIFRSPNLKFLVSDMTHSLDRGLYDLIVMVDVYEHIARKQWPNFNKIISDCLSDDGVVVLTTPSPYHQEYLREHEPNGLQIIDETVLLDDVCRLASDTYSTITHYCYSDVWKTNQYLHVVLERKPEYAPVRKERRTPLTQLFFKKVLNLAKLCGYDPERSKRRKRIFDATGIWVK